MASYTTLSDRLIFALRMILPYGILALLFLLGLISAPFPFSWLLDAPLFLMAVYYWSIFRPTLLPPWLVFALGLLSDILGGGLLGVQAGLLVAVRMIVMDQRLLLMSQSFMTLWLGFMVVNAGFHIMEWLLFSLLSWTIMPLGALVMNVFSGLILFPPVHLLLHLAHKALPVPVLHSTLRQKVRRR